MEQRNLLIAIVLSVGILIGFQFVFQRLHPPAPHVGPESTAPAAPATAPGAGSVAPGTAAPGAVAAKAAETVEAATAGQPRIAISTPRLHGSIALKGGRFDDLTLVRYRETVDPKSPAVQLLSPPGTVNPYLAEFGWVAAEPGALKLPGPDTLWKASDGPLTASHPVTLTWDNGEGLVFTRTISVDADYMFTIRDEVRNTGNATVKLLPYGLVSRTGTPQVSGYYILFEGMLGYIDGALREVKYSSLRAGQPDDLSSTGGWLGFTDKYWQTSLIPEQNEAIRARFTHTLENGVDHYQTDYLGSARTLAPNST